MKPHLRISIIFLLATLCLGQIHIKEIPISFRLNLGDTLNFLLLPALQVPENATFATAKENDPLQFALGVKQNINVIEEGEKSLVEGGSIFRLGMKCLGALSINFQFSNYALHKEDRLWIYSCDKAHVVGAFSAINNKDSKRMATFPVEGDCVILELFVPRTGPMPSLEIEEVNRAFLPLYAVYEPTAGICNTNVVCPIAEAFRNQAKSVARILIDGKGWCSGALINNALQDKTQYFLTAFHCLKKSYEDFVFEFKYDSKACESNIPPEEGGTVSVSGAVVVASWNISDFALLKIEEPIPLEATAYLSGWDRRETPPFEPTGIHHPRGDLKKISIYSGYAIGHPWNIDDLTHWQIPQWSIGTTESASSGSPLYSDEALIVGQLQGGQAICDMPINDYYGKFSWSWNKSSNTSEQLAPYLDPLQKGIEKLEGEFL